MNRKMNEYRKAFDEYGCLYLGQILTKEECDEALLKLFIAKENGEHIKDSMGFDVSFGNLQLDYLLIKVQPMLEKILDMKLFPTYSYSRIYHKGDKLHLHVDRNSCEVSVTISLGYGGDSLWPFVILNRQDTQKNTNFVDDGSDYFGESIAITPELKNKLEKIIIIPGDGVLYKGMELGHAREEYIEGNWQAQVFLHYVDVNGKNAKHKYDQIIKGLINGTGN